MRAQVHHHLTIAHLVVLPVRQIQEGLASKLRTVCTLLAALIRVGLNVFGVHRSVHELGGLAVADTFLLFELVQEGKQ
jgi:hypothetical protein